MRTDGRQGVQVDVGAGGNTTIRTDANGAAVAAAAGTRDPNYRWHNNHWWYKTNNGWVFWYDNQWRPYNRSTYYTYYPRGWNNGYYATGPYRSYYRWPSSNYGYDNGYGYGYGYPYGWRGGRGYNRGWYDSGLRYGGRAFRRW